MATSSHNFTDSLFSPEEGGAACVIHGGLGMAVKAWRSVPLPNQKFCLFNLGCVLLAMGKRHEGIGTLRRLFSDSSDLGRLISFRKELQKWVERKGKAGGKGEALCILNRRIDELESQGDLQEPNQRNEDEQ